MVKKYYSDELYHHGVKGMHWGVRRYQNAQGGLTPEGYRHYGYDKRVAKNNAKIDKWNRIERSLSTNYGKTYAAERAAKYKADNESIKGFSKDSKHAKLYRHGDKYNRNLSLALASAHERRAKDATKIGGSGGHLANTAYAYNNRRAAKIYNTASKKKGIERASYLIKSNFKTPYKTVAGRTTNVGKEFIRNMTTFGLYSTMADASYKHNYKKQLMNKARNK